MTNRSGPSDHIVNISVNICELKECDVGGPPSSNVMRIHRRSDLAGSRMTSAATMATATQLVWAIALIAVSGRNHEKVNPQTLFSVRNQVITEACLWSDSQAVVPTEMK